MCRALVGAGTLLSRDASLKTLARELGLAELASGLQGGGSKAAEAAADVAALLAD